MASKLEKELLIYAINKDVSPGSLYDISTKKHSPCDTKHPINIEECIEHNVIVRSKEEILSFKKSFSMYEYLHWTKDFDTTEFSDCISLHGEKICEHKGNVEPHVKLCVVSSVYYKTFIDMLIYFDKQLQEKDVEDVKNYVKRLVGMKKNEDNFRNKSEGTDFNKLDTTLAFIPQAICNGFSSGYIYEKGNKIPVTSIKYGLEEFCNYLVHSQSKVTLSFKLKKPQNTAQVSYASVLRNESTVNVPDKRPADHLQIDQPYCIDGVSDNVAHTMKPTQGVELPVAHNTRSNTKARASNCVISGQHSNVRVKNLEQNKNIPDRRPDHLRRPDKTHFGKPVDKSGEHQAITHQVSDRKSCDHGSEVHNTFKVSQDDACTQYSRKNMHLQSSQNITKKLECVALDTYPSENCKSYEPKSNSSTEQNFAQKTQFQEKLNLPHLIPIADDLNISEKHEDSIKRSQLKLEYKNVNPQIISEKSHISKLNRSEFNNSCAEPSPTLLMPLNEYMVCGMIRKFYGVIPEAEGKTVILLGASGSGKTTLVNFIANYFSGNKKAAGKLIQVVRNSNDIQGHTTKITGYTFCASKDDNPLTIIDTPGLNDSSGAEVHDHVQSLKTFLANVHSQNLKIHAIGFVAQAHIVRLTSSERLVMDYIFSLFGKEIGKHVITFVTFSDNQEAPPVVEAINSYGVSCSVFLKFNNSALSSNKEEEIDELDRIYWRIGCKSLKKCIKLLENIPSVSFKSLTVEIYGTQIIEVAERNLRTEIKDFMDHHRRNNVLAISINAERVWTSAGIVKELRCINVSQCLSVDDILLSYVEEMCSVQNSYLSTKECIKLLSLSPSRPLLKAGLAIISNMTPIYNSVKQACSQSQSWVQKRETQDMLFCFVCGKDHVLERVLRKPGWIRTNTKMAYKCTVCKCPGDVHGEKGEKHELPESNKFTPGKLLHHTRNCIEKVLQDFCFPVYKIQVIEYVNWLKCFAKREAQQFCDDLLRS